MAKLYIFGIGGTGSRVLKSLTMLLASGVKLDSDIEKVVPIIIDPDLANGDMSRTLNIMKLYHEIRKDINNPKDFFNTSIQTLNQAQSGAAFSCDQFQFSIDGTNNKKFKQFIGDATLSKANSSLKELLFSEKNLEADMNVGFKGNPNIGSIVLNQLVESCQFQEFAQSYSPGDRIFIINSIFGGTGAAGFPLLVKNLRSNNSDIPGAEEISNAVIGAVTVLPYFNVSNDSNSEINSDTFIDKAKSAMGYYDRTLLQNNALNGFYYIGDTSKVSFSNSEGSESQKNDAHFIELAAALSIVDFCKEAPRLSSSNRKAEQPYFKEYGIDADPNVSTISFGQLDSVSRDLIKLPLSKFMMSHLYLKEGLFKAKKTMWMVDKSTKTDSSFFSSVEYVNVVKSFFDYFIEWFQEMDRNDVSFSPFNFNVDANSALHFIDGVKPKKKGIFKSDDSFDGMTKVNSNCFIQYNKDTAVNQLFKMLEHSTEEVMKDRNLI